MLGLLNVDKPQGWTSHDIVGRLRRVTGIRKIGHAGTLDPLATGVLVVAVGRATRLLEYIVGQPKQYTTTVKLGEITDSYDADGDIVECHEVAVSKQDIAAVLPQFIGDIDQLPPIFSAIKKDGQPLYKLARQGKEVTVEPRRVSIKSLETVGFESPNLRLRVDCGTGTYIRSLAHDIGQALGCGGHVAELRRTRVGGFTSEDAVPIDEITPENVASLLKPMALAVAHLPRLDVDNVTATMLKHGKRIPRSSDEPLVSVWENDQFLGLVRGDGDTWRVHKFFH